MSTSGALTTRLFFLIFLFSSQGGMMRAARADESIGLCCLCSGCRPALSYRQNMEVDSTGKTCNMAFLEMADPSKFPQGSGKCNAAKARFQNRCCNPNHCPQKIEVTHTKILDEFPEGPHPPCDLCHNGQYPKSQYTITAVLGFDGNPTCRDLYYMGLAGSISQQMCNPLQDFYHHPCGCYEESDDEDDDDSDGEPEYGCRRRGLRGHDG